MDILAHALWTNALYEGVERRKRSWREILEVVFWSDFPDFFTFGVLFAVDIATFQFPGHFGTLDEANFPEWLFSMHYILYSLPLFFLIFFIIWFLRGKPYWAIGGWLVHIFIDVFTHDSFFPPHFLWPFSDFHLELITWASPTFMAFNYGALTVTYVGLYFWRRNWSR
ncbi:MAG: hypothetical protein Q8P97_01735 [bacterium]|nr:hypothetical protein [bacterium]